MRCILFCLLALCFVASASHIRRFTQEDSRPNQFLVFDDDDTSVLIDTGLGTPEGNVDLVNFINSQGVDNLNAIFITHAHPDHYGGVPFLAESFPDARIEVATQQVHDELVANAPLFFPYEEFDWENNIIVQDDDEFYDELDLLVLSDFPGAESQSYGMIYNADDNYIVTGDALFIDFHPYLGSGVNLQSLRSWYGDTLLQLSDGGAIGLNKNTVYYPGHGPQGDYLQVAVLIKYLQDFEDLVLSCPNTEFPILLETVKTRLISDYPKFEGRDVLDSMTQNSAWIVAPTNTNPCAIFQRLTSDSSAGSLSISLFAALAIVAILL